MYGFGTLIGNSEFHNGNLSFPSEHGPPYHIAPADDMLRMAFTPRSGGTLPADLPATRLHPGVRPGTRRQKHSLAAAILAAKKGDGRFSPGWAP